MKTQCLLCVVFCASAAALSNTSAAPGDPGAGMMLSIKLLENATADSKARILAEPSIVTTIGRSFHFVAGGTLKPKTGGGELEIGTRISGTIERSPDGAVHVALKIRVGERVSQAGDPDTDLVRTETLDLRTVLRPGVTKRIKYSQSQSCEVRVDALP